MSSQDRPRELIRQSPSSGLACATHEVLGARLVLAVAAPRTSATFAEEATEVLETIKRLVEQPAPPVSIVGQSVFLADFEDRKLYGRMASGLFGGDVPTTTYIAQRPCGGERLAVELWGVQQGEQAVEIQRAGEDATVVRLPDVAVAQLVYRHRITAGQSFEQAAADAFREVDRRLTKLGFRFDHVFRSWFYIGKIATAEDRETRYEQLNRVRGDFYLGLRFAAGLLPRDFSGSAFPASTGIGAGGNDLTVSCLALAAERSDLTLVPLENPRQTSAFAYDSQFGEQPPKFARAMAAVSGDRAVTFISGTASIAEADSTHLDDVERQTQLTLENIASLISADNFRRHGLPGLGATLDDLASARVYLKRAEDYERVRTICRRRLGELPLVFVVADVCRPELLVEIEGVAVSRRM